MASGRAQAVGDKPIPGAFDFNALQQALHDPAIKQMAEQIAKDPAFAKVTEEMQQRFASMIGPGYIVPDGSENRPEGPGAASVPDPSYYMNAMTAMFEKQEFLEKAEKLGSEIIENDPNMETMIQSMKDPVYRGRVEDALSKMRADNEMKTILDELELLGPMAMMKYWNNPEVLSKLGVAMGDAFDFRGLQVDEEEDFNEPDADATVHSAALAGDAKQLLELLQHGANVNEKDEEARTALHLACGYGEIECAQVLIDHKANLNLVDANKNSALHYAAGYGQADASLLLIQSGADRTLKNVDGKTALEVAQLNNREDVLKALKTDPTPAPTPREGP